MNDNLTREQVITVLNDVKEVLYFHKPELMGPLNEWAITDESLRAQILELEKSLRVTQIERDTYRGMVRQIAMDQPPIQVLAEGMTIVLERDKKIAELTEEAARLKRHMADLFNEAAEKSDSEFGSPTCHRK